MMCALPDKSSARTRQQDGDPPVSAPSWRKIDGVDRGALREARLQAHYAVQWLARAARAYATPAPIDHHTNLGWNDAITGFTTQTLPQGAVVGLNIAQLMLTLWDSMAPPQSIDLQGRGDVAIRQWLGWHLSANKGLDPGALDRPSPYRMPEHPIGDGAPYGAAGLGPALADLASWYANANDVLGETRQRILARGIAAPPVRCWPHHFDLDSLISLGTGAGTHSVGVGFSPGDAYYDQPYFYVSRYPPPDVASLPSLAPLGHWHTHHFTAAVATADRVVAAWDPRAETEAYLRAATDILIGRP
jgi:hypothetical protein